MQRQSERRQSRKLDLAVAIVLVGAFALTWGGISVASAAGKEDPGEQIAALRSAQNASDHLPDGFPASAHGHYGISPETSHFVGEFGTVKFWTADDISTGDLCLLASDASAGVTAGSCAPSSMLKSGPIPLSATYNGKRVFEAFLIGDAYSDAEITAPWVKAGHNLVVVDGEVATNSEIAIHSKSGSQKLAIKRFPDAPVNDARP